MKYRLVKNEDEIIVIVEDGGIATIREVEELDEGDGRQATTDYYQDRLTKEMIADDDVWGNLGNGNMYWNDWKTPFNNPEHIVDALEWLCVGEDNFEVDENIWKEF